MNINRQFFAQSFLTIGALLRTFDPCPTKQFANYESQIKAEVEKDVQQNKPKDGKSRKPRFPFARGRQRRPYIQFEDGSYRVL